MKNTKHKPEWCREHDSNEKKKWIYQFLWFGGGCCCYSFFFLVSAQNYGVMSIVQWAITMRSGFVVTSSFVIGIALEWTIWTRIEICNSIFFWLLAVELQSNKWRVCVCVVAHQASRQLIILHQYILNETFFSYNILSTVNSLLAVLEWCHWLYRTIRCLANKAMHCCAVPCAEHHNRNNARCARNKESL